MGLLSNLKNKIQEMLEKVTRKKLAEPQTNYFKQSGYLENPVTVYTSNHGDYEMITALNQFGQEYIGLDGTIGKLMVAHIKEGNQERGLSGFNQNFVAFELPDNVLPNDPTLLDNVVSYYLQRKSLSAQKDCLFIGNPVNHNTNTQDYIQDMQSYVDVNIGTQISQFKQEEDRKRQLEQARINELHRKQDEASQNRNYANNQNRFEEQNNVRLNRMNHPYIQQYGTQNYVAKDGKTYNDYNAVNVESGDILKIRKLNKVGIDQTSGRYLYTRLHSKYL